MSREQPLLDVAVALPVAPVTEGGAAAKHFAWPVEMINLVFAVFDKAGNVLAGPTDSRSLWAGFAVPGCTDPSGDPIVLSHKLENRWLLTQFTTRGPVSYNCVAVSVSGDPTGSSEVVHPSRARREDAIRARLPRHGASHRSVNR